MSDTNRPVWWGEIEVQPRLGVEQLTFEHLSTVNRQRCTSWHPGFPDDEAPGREWSLADWSNAMVGEAGEAANVVKKIRRIETSNQSAVQDDLEDLKVWLGEELADTIIYADLVATKMGINLAEAIVNKFNKISEREGLEHRL